MALLIFLSVVLLNLEATTSQSDCKAVKLSGPFIPTQFKAMGAVFQQLQVDTNSLPVFARDIGNGNRSTSPGLKQVLGVYELCKSHPADDRRTWEAVSSTNIYLLTPYPDVRVECAEAPKSHTVSCNSIRITGPTIPYQARRQQLIYTSTNETRCGRPIFKATESEVIAYDCIDFGWVVAELIGQSQRIILYMYVISTVGHPVEVTGTWYAREGVSNSSYKAYPALSMECVGEAGNPHTSTIMSSTPYPRTGRTTYNPRSSFNTNIHRTTTDRTTYNPRSSLDTHTHRPTREGTTVQFSTVDSSKTAKNDGRRSSVPHFSTTTVQNRHSSSSVPFFPISTFKNRNQPSSTRFSTTTTAKTSNRPFFPRITTPTGISTTRHVGKEGSEWDVTTADNNGDSGRSGDNSDDDNGSSNVGVIVGSTVAAVVVVALVSVVVWQRWKMTKQQEARSPTGPTGNKPIQPSDPTVRYSVRPTSTRPLPPLSSISPSAPPMPPSPRTSTRKQQGNTDMNTQPGPHEYQNTEAAVYEDLRLYDEPPVEDKGNYKELTDKSNPQGYIEVIPELPYEYVPSTNDNRTTHV